MTHTTIYKKVILFAWLLAIAVSLISSSPVFAGGVCGTVGQTGC